MNRGSTLFLRFVLCLIAISTMIGLIWFPQAEGRATNLNFMSIYTDPFILYCYISSIPFFAALFQAYKLLGYVDKRNIFSQSAINAVRNVKSCALAISVFLVVAIFLIRVMSQGDDSAGPTMMGLVAIFISLVIVTTTAIFQKLLQNAVDIKSENDLTV